MLILGINGMESALTVASVVTTGALTVGGAASLNGAIAVNGALAINGDVTNLVSDQMKAWPVVTSAFTNADQRCYAVYLGRAPRKITSCQVSILLGATAAAAVVYAELALATGAYEPVVGSTAGSPDLTLVPGSVADISGDLGVINFMVTKTITPTTPIAAGTELWAIVSVDAGTQPVWRSIANDSSGVNAYRDATRPSTMGAASAFTSSTFNVVADSPHMFLHIVS